MKGSIKKDGSTWNYLVYIGVDENGKKKYKRKRGFKTKKECEIALAKLITELEKGTNIENDNITVKEYMDYWFPLYPEKECQPATLKRYNDFRKDINKYLGNIKLQKLNPLAIQTFYKNLSVERKLSNNTIIKIHRMLHLSLKHAQQWQMIYTNPCDLVNTPKATKQEMNYWNPDKITSYLELLKESTLYPAIFLAVHTGMRAGELCGLKWGDINLKDGFLKVERTLQRIDGKLTEKIPKTIKSKRIITLLPSTIEFLENMKSKDNNNSKIINLKYSKNSYVLSWEDGRPMDPHYLSQKFPKLLEENKIPKVRFHDLRHTHATLLLKLGTNPKVISERLGHSTVSFTLDTYSHVNIDMQKEEVSKANNFL